MSRGRLTRARITGGVWEGVIEDRPERPEVTAHHAGTTIEGVSVEGTPDGDWLIRVPIPPETISDGVQSYVLTDAATGETLESFALLAGETMADDLRAEIALLRAELDMLKRAFRRHCRETG